MEELRIKCPACGVILDVKNSKNEAVKRIACPSCKTTLDIAFHEETKVDFQIGSLFFGDARYELKEGTNVIGRKHPSSKADIQIATGDPLLQTEHACVNVIRLKNGDGKCVLNGLPSLYSSADGCCVSVAGLPLVEGDEVLLQSGDEIQLGETIIIYK